MPQEICENKKCSLISQEENDQVCGLLGVRCQTLATTVVQLYITEPPHHMQWIKKDTGILCFVKDNFRKNYFFRIYCLKRNNMVWEQEVYNNLEYISPQDFFHSFEGEGYMVAFNFASSMEAKELKIVVDRKLQAKKKREEKRSSRMNFNLQPELANPRLPSSSDLMMYRKHTDPNERKAKRRRNITKADISNPSEFRHVSHVGFDPDRGFDINGDDPQLNTFFQKAGVSEKQLQDRNTREFIYNFINNYGGRAAIQETVQETRKPAPAPPSPVAGPPVPPRSTHNRAAPPPPPSLSQAPKPVLVPKNSTLNSTPQSVPGVSPPPPPPPPMAPPAPTIQAEISAQPPAQDMRSALMESIRGGATLKPLEIDVEKRSTLTDSGRNDLMSEIRKGFQLKPAVEREVKPVSPLNDQPGRGDLACALARALAERNRVIHSEDDSTSDTDSNDEEWDA
ncbi:hypothetical protein RI129_005489 [Pyrocoelia pectoralis]|uniref:Neural Wiskott-Aldrich syndrome protein n=1 Tax=Pyrocoelia pectoralis TaxID=417401 RepID=A0AAN7VEX3_9COLE